MKLGASILSVVGAFYYLVVSLVFTLSVTGRFPAEELVALTMLNIGFSMSVCDAWIRDCWYPLYLLTTEALRRTSRDWHNILLRWLSFVSYVTAYGMSQFSQQVLCSTTLCLAG
jgi:hypothetical protein